MEKIGKQLRDARLLKRLSMERVAALSGLTYKTILSAEHGKPTSLQTLMAICDTLGLEITIREKEV